MAHSAGFLSVRTAFLALALMAALSGAPGDAKADASQLEISATDLEVGIRGFHPADVSKAGSLTVSARKLFEIVRGDHTPKD